MEEKTFTLTEAIDLIRSVSLSRGAVLSSSPEEIVWLTAEAISEQFRATADWQPTHRDEIEWAVLRSINGVKMGESVRASLIKAVKIELSGYPRC